MSLLSRKFRLALIFAAWLVINFLSSCDKAEVEPENFVSSKITVNNHQLACFSHLSSTKYLIVFEPGLGDNHTIWYEKKLPQRIATTMDVLLYDRAGYGKSSKAPAPRDIPTLSAELAEVIEQFRGTRKVILVGHSLAGMIMRSYAVAHPENVAGILFVDPSHEAYNDISQEEEDQIYDTFNSAYGPDFGGTQEARELREAVVYLNTLGDLPDVPVTVLTSMKIDATHSAADRDEWYAAHELYKEGVSDFTHLTTIKAGHYIFLEDPDLVWEQLNLLLAKLP